MKLKAFIPYLDFHLDLGLVQIVIGVHKHPEYLHEYQYLVVCFGWFHSEKGRFLFKLYKPGYCVFQSRRHETALEKRFRELEEAMEIAHLRLLQGSNPALFDKLMPTKRKQLCDESIIMRLEKCFPRLVKEHEDFLDEDVKTRPPFFI